MANAPYCNVDVATPQAKPVSPKGIAPIPPNASQSQMIQIINNNFQQLVKGNFIENRGARQTEIVRIYDPASRANYVDVRQIVAVQWVNNLTGQVVNWKR